VNWTLNNLDLIREYTLNHIQLAIVPIVLSFVLALPLGWLANRTWWSRAVVITTGSLLFTIPSLPLFVILPTILPTRVLDETNLVVALTIYGVAIMTRSAADALAAVEPDTVDAAHAIGFSSAGRLFRVELPLAGPVLLAGIRVVSVSTIALVSVGVIIGSENLGFFFADGKRRGLLEEVVVGILISLLLALVFDLLIVALGKLLMPWNRRDRTSSRRGAAPAEPDPAGLIADDGPSLESSAPEPAPTEGRAR